MGKSVFSCLCRIPYLVQPSVLQPRTRRWKESTIYTYEEWRECRLIFIEPLCSEQEKAMAPHSSTLVWKIPWTEEPGRLQSMGSRRVGHDSDFTFTFHFHALEKEIATHSSVLAWRIPGGAWWAAIYRVA